MASQSKRIRVLEAGDVDWSRLTKLLQKASDETGRGLSECLLRNGFCMFVFAKASLKETLWNLKHSKAMNHLELQLAKIPKIYKRSAFSAKPYVHITDRQGRDAKPHRHEHGHARSGIAPARYCFDQTSGLSVLFCPACPARVS